MRSDHPVRWIVGVACLVLAGSVLALGYWWSLLVWSGGEYAQPPPSLGHKLGEVLPWALITVAVAAVPAIVSAFLIVTSRPTDRMSRRRSVATLLVLVAGLVVVASVLGVWAAADVGTDRWRAASTLLFVAVVDAVLILLITTRALTVHARARWGARLA